MSQILRQRRLLRFGLPALTAAGTLGALGFARAHFQNRRLFSPERYPSGDWRPVARGFEALDCWFPSEGGLQLHGWWIPRRNARATLLYCHGNSGSLGLGVRVLRHFAALEANLFAFDYRGYGRSEGKPSELGLFQDARAAFRHLAGSLGQDPRSVVLFGHSLGGAVAIDSALDLPVAGLVVQASFTDVRGMARSLFPRLPMHWLARNQFRSIDKIPRIAVPKLFIHGRQDETVPFAMGCQLYEAAQGEKLLVAIDGGGHNDLHLRGGQRYLDSLQSFLDRCTAR
jgi:fermentation-respiration switch protein FrsA (DUF1100 family)